MSVDSSTLTTAQRWALADKLAEDRLPQINAGLADVVPSCTLYARYGKRVIDVVLSGIALVVLLIPNLIIGVATFFDVGLPLFFRQERVGKGGKTFTIVKFRNMRNTRDERGELLPPDQRVTRFGKFMRKTSLDELLNFWSVFKGDMSLIGPRPLVSEYTHRYNKRHVCRLMVRPGLECPPRSLDGSLRTWSDQFENDVWYVEHLSLRTDLMMFWNLVRFTFDRKNAEARSQAKRGIFMGYDERGEAITFDEVDPALIEQFSHVQAVCQPDGTAKVVRQA